MGRPLFLLVALALANQAHGQSDQALRGKMARDQIQARGVKDPAVLRAMVDVPRELFVPADQRRHAFADRPLPIGLGQTISQPYIVAYMTEALELRGQEKVLEIGTGSGYQAAILSRLAAEVYSMEIVPELSRRAGETLLALGIHNVHLRVGDGYQGWPEAGPFDAIMVTAAPDHVPPALVKQLAPRGRMIIPVGGSHQELLLIRPTPQGTRTERLLPVLFVPMTGKAQQQ